MIDNTNPRVWADVAFGRYENGPVPLNIKTKISKKQIDFRTPLKVWRCNYVLALKIAALSLDGGKSHKLIEELFEWMYSEYIFRLLKLNY